MISQILFVLGSAEMWWKKLMDDRERKNVKWEDEVPTCISVVLLLFLLLRHRE